MAKILVVDDETQLRAAVCRFLDRIGHSVVRASDGKEGVEAYERENPDLVLMDIAMPVMGGLEAIGRIMTSHPAACIIALSAGWPEHVMNPLAIARDLGAKRTVDKPYELGEIKTVIDELLNSPKTDGTE